MCLLRQNFVSLYPVLALSDQCFIYYYQAHQDKTYVKKFFVKKFFQKVKKFFHLSHQDSPHQDKTNNFLVML